MGGSFFQDFSDLGVRVKFCLRLIAEFGVKVSMFASTS